VNQTPSLFLAIAAVVASHVAAGDASPPAPHWHRNSDGTVRVQPVPAPAELRNPWPDVWELEFQQRASRAIQAQAVPGGYGGTYFENEKRSYGRAMLSILGGHELPALKFLQAEDADAKSWNQSTLGIDLFPAFTLKMQVRKYFYFGPWLEAAYRARMKEAARLWTEQDPFMRPHPAYRGKPTGEDWTPRGKNSWVDVRGTDNLKLMRDTSAYLFAEETGNESTRQIYKRRLVEFIGALYRVGNAEWDSENYLGHGIAPLLNLYDFAKDMEVRRLAKAGLDWLCCTAAVKYWRGNFCGPCRRDYNHPWPFGGSAPMSLWMYFGDAPAPPTTWETDEIHHVTSSYRPPAAAVAVARRAFPLPVETRNCKPPWDAWKTAKTAAPAFRETLYMTRDFQIGSLTQGTCEPDVNGFKILVADNEQGAAQIIAAPCSDPKRLGSPQSEKGILAGPSAVGQHGNLVIYLTAEAPQPYLWIVPTNARIVHDDGLVIIHTEKCAVAIWPINATPPEFDLELTAQLTKKSADAKNSVLRSERAAPGVYGFALEISEKLDPTRFAALASERRPDIKRLKDGSAEMTGAEGRSLRVQWAADPLEIGIWRDGVRRDWAASEENWAFGAFGELDGAPLQQGWRGGTLRVRAGEHYFRASVHEDGRVEFSHRR
jgi:hypothetical protein